MCFSLAQVMQAYYDTVLPQPGEDFEFSPDETLQPVHFHRPKLRYNTGAAESVHRIQIANVESEAAEGLRYWAVAVLCRCLSLQNVLTLLAGKFRAQNHVPLLTTSFQHHPIACKSKSGQE